MFPPYPTGFPRERWRWCCAHALVGSGSPSKTPRRRLRDDGCRAPSLWAERRKGYRRRRFGILGCPLSWGGSGSHLGCLGQDRPWQARVELGSGALTTHYNVPARGAAMAAVVPVRRQCPYRAGGACARPDEQWQRPHVCLCSASLWEAAGASPEQVRGSECVPGLRP